MVVRETRISTKEAAEILHIDVASLQAGVRQEKLPIGCYIRKEGKSRGGYYLSRRKVLELAREWFGSDPCSEDKSVGQR